MWDVDKRRFLVVTLTAKYSVFDGVFACFPKI